MLGLQPCAINSILGDNNGSQLNEHMNEKDATLMHDNHPGNECYVRHPTAEVTQIPETLSSLKPFIPKSSHQLLSEFNQVIHSSFPRHCNHALTSKTELEPRGLETSHSAAEGRGALVDQASPPGSPVQLLGSISAS